MIKKISRALLDPLLKNAREIYIETIFRNFHDGHEKAHWIEFDY